MGCMWRSITLERPDHRNPRSRLFRLPQRTFGFPQRPTPARGVAEQGHSLDLMWGLLLHCRFGSGIPLMVQTTRRHLLKTMDYTLGSLRYSVTLSLLRVHLLALTPCSKTAQAFKGFLLLFLSLL